MNKLENQRSTAITRQQQELRANSAFKIYKNLAVHNSNLAIFIYYELAQLISQDAKGALGVALRSLMLKPLLSGTKKKLILGKGISLKQPSLVTIGDRVIIDELATVEVRKQTESVSFIEIADDCFIGKQTIVSAKNGFIRLAKGVNIGSLCRIATNSSIEIGESSLIGAYCYIGPGDHGSNACEPIATQDMVIKDGVKIGKNCWLGARVTVVDGVKIGDNSIIGAHSLVRDDVPENSIAVGTPAKIIKTRA